MMDIGIVWIILLCIVGVVIFGFLACVALIVLFEVEVFLFVGIPLAFMWIFCSILYTIQSWCSWLIGKCGLSSKAKK